MGRLYHRNARQRFVNWSKSTRWRLLPTISSSWPLLLLLGARNVITGVSKKLTSAEPFKWRHCDFRLAYRHLAANEWMDGWTDRQKFSLFYQQRWWSLHTIHAPARRHRNGDFHTHTHTQTQHATTRVAFINVSRDAVWILLGSELISYTTNYTLHGVERLYMPHVQCASLDRHPRRHANGGSCRSQDEQREAGNLLAASNIAHSQWSAKSRELYCFLL